MKVKVWVDSNNRLLHWANASDFRSVGPTDDGYSIIEVDTPAGLYENHASIVDGKVVPDPDYVPDTTPSDTSTTASATQQIVDLQKSNDELQSALLELSDLVLSGGGSK